MLATICMRETHNPLLHNTHKSHCQKIYFASAYTVGKPTIKD